MSHKLLVICPVYITGVLCKWCSGVLSLLCCSI